MTQRSIAETMTLFMFVCFQTGGVIKNGIVQICRQRSQRFFAARTPNRGSKLLCGTYMLVALIIQLHCIKCIHIVKCWAPSDYPHANNVVFSLIVRLQLIAE